VKTLRAQFVVSHLVPLLVLIPLLGLIVLYIVETQVLLTNLVDDLSGEAAVLAEIAGQQGGVFVDRGQAEFFVRAAGAQYEHEVALFDRQGDAWLVLVENNIPFPPQPNVGELSRLETGEIQRRAIFHIDVAQEDAEVFAPVLDPQGRLLGIVRVSAQIELLYSRLTQLRSLVLGATFVALVVAVGVALILASRTAGRLDRVTNAITQVAEGNAPSKVDEPMPREFRAPFDAVGDLQTRLRESESTRRKLLANLVHELGRPLGALQAAIHALEQGADDDKVLRRELLQGMDGQVERLKPLLDNLASLHGGLSGAMQVHRRPVDLNEWLAGVTVTWRQAAESKGLSWREEIPTALPIVMLDPDRMAQVIGNLLSNAIKFTPGGGTVEVSAGQNEKEVWIAVRDSGPGIAAADLSHIFEPLYRGSRATAEPLNRFPQGMGLGLAIAHDLVSAHAGRITVESTEGKGSCFTVFLPV
jgi:signal transduction histidine kinase